MTIAAYNPVRLRRIADVAAVLVAISLPWSVSATSILIAVWLLTLLPTLDWQAVRREILTPAGGLPVLLVLIGALGMLWAEVPWRERWAGFDSFPKLLAIPLLFVQFRESPRAIWVFRGFLLSCMVLLLASYALAFFFNGAIEGINRSYGVPVKDYIAQSGEFTACALGLLYCSVESMRRRSYAVAIVSLLIAAAFLSNIFYITTSRTAIVVLPILLALLGFQLFGWRGMVATAFAALMIAGAVWTSSGYLRDRLNDVALEVSRYRTSNADTSSGERLEFLKKSLQFVADAPLLGHGTGSIRDQFQRAAVGESGASAVVSENPHNQTLAIAIQLGLLGVIALWAMWLVHLSLFIKRGFTCWLGLLVVSQNIIGSLFNSHLFDFTQGWMYIFGVGVAGAMAQGQAEDEETIAPMVKAAVRS